MRSISLGISASFSSQPSSGNGRELLVQHLLIKENDLDLLLELQQRVSAGPFSSLNFSITFFLYCHIIHGERKEKCKRLCDIKNVLK